MSNNNEPIPASPGWAFFASRLSCADFQHRIRIRRDRTANKDRSNRRKQSNKIHWLSPFQKNGNKCQRTVRIAPPASTCAKLLTWNRVRTCRHPDRSEAKWRDLFLLPAVQPTRVPHPTLCVGWVSEDAQSASECVPQFPNRNLVQHNPQKRAISPHPIRYTGNRKNRNARDHSAGVFMYVSKRVCHPDRSGGICFFFSAFRG
jgi:hypothetical protein